MALRFGTLDIVPLFGALVAGFAFFLVAGYLALFDRLVLDSDLLLIGGGVLVGYAAARVGNG